MKSIDPEALSDLSERQINPGETFSFQCHPDVSCFNRCCRNLNLFLYPYDILRLKKNLGITSDELIEKHLDIVLRPSNHFPDVLLRMSDTDEKTCPFLSNEGCLVYPDRPDSCRTFPIEQGMMYRAGQKKGKLVHFFRPPDFCMGQYRSKTWTPESWAIDQEAVDYNRMTILWSELKSLFQESPWPQEGPNGPKAKMAFMATYNLDMFRDFIFNSSFLKRYKVKADLLKKIRKNETELMKFGFSWVKFYLWGIKTKKIRLR